MTHDLRALVRERLRSGALPSELPDLAAGGPSRLAEVRIGTVADALCTICRNPAPQVTYVYRGRRVLRLHAACEAIWRQEVADWEV